MVARKRITMIENNLSGLMKFLELRTQELRVKIIDQLEHLFAHAVAMAQSRAVENREDWVKIASCRGKINEKKSAIYTSIV